MQSSNATCASIISWWWEVQGGKVWIKSTTSSRGLSIFRRAPRVEAIALLHLNILKVSWDPTNTYITFLTKGGQFWPCVADRTFFNRIRSVKALCYWHDVFYWKEVICGPTLLMKRFLTKGGQLGPHLIDITFIKNNWGRTTPLGFSHLGFWSLNWWAQGHFVDTSRW